MLSKDFQLKFVDVTRISNIVHIEIAQIRTMFIVDTHDLNVDAFNECTSYHVLYDYGPYGGYLKRLQSQVKANKFHGFQM